MSRVVHGGAKCIARGQQHRSTGDDLLIGELPDCRGLADTVDPDEHPDVRASSISRLKRQRSIGSLKALVHFVT